MLLGSRRRRSAPYALASEAPLGFLLSRAARYVILLVTLSLFALWLFFRFQGDALARRGVTLHMDRVGSANVWLEGGNSQRAQDGMKLFPGERIQTGPQAGILLEYFDGTSMVLGTRTDLTLRESAQGVKESTVDVALSEGTIWIRTPDWQSFSGSILRKITTPALSMQIPARSEAILSSSSLLVFSADGPGLLVRTERSNAAPIFVGEGQQLSLKSGEVPNGDLYAFRSPLPPEANLSEFRQSAKSAHADMKRIGRPGTQTGTGADALTILSPSENASIPGSSVEVRGRVTNDVAQVRVNGYMATIRLSDRTFTQTLSLPSTGSMTIEVEAIAADGEVLRSINRTVVRVVQELAAPTLTSPAKNGETFRTGKSEILIKGEINADAEGVMVNDYRLQLYKKGEGSWTYLASERLQNLSVGTNVFDVFALDALGRKSKPARLTVVYEPGAADGLVSASTSSAQGATSSQTLANNDPLMPGSLTVTAPRAGTEHTETGTGELLIEGQTSEKTASIWVNDYRLQLYKGGRTVWNYIASASLGTMKTGRNTYAVIARNANGEILDKLTYTIIYQPSSASRAPSNQSSQQSSSVQAQ
jgi:hypothetical protein